LRVSRSSKEHPTVAELKSKDFSLIYLNYLQFYFTFPSIFVANFILRCQIIRKRRRKKTERMLNVQKGATVVNRFRAFPPPAFPHFRGNSRSKAEKDSNNRWQVVNSSRKIVRGGNKLRRILLLCGFVVKINSPSSLALYLRLNQRKRKFMM
jgi:hypothetical protein